MGGFDLNGVSSNRPVTGTTGNNGSQPVNNEGNYDFGFTNTEEIGDSVKINTTQQPAFTQFDLDQMYAMAGITKPESIKPLEKTMAFAAEGAEYGVTYSEEDMNLARFIFEHHIS